MEEGEVAVEHSVYCTERKELDRSEAVTEVGFEAEQRTAPSGCDRVSPEAEVWVSGGERVRNSGRETRAMGWDAALWGSEEPAWVPQACLSDLASEADCLCLPPSLADWEAAIEDQESRAVRRQTDEFTLYNQHPACFRWETSAYCVGRGLLNTWRWAISQCRCVFCLSI